MIRYSKEKRTRILQTYIRTMSITEAQRDYRIHFETRISPSKNTIKSLYRKFADTGNVNDKPRSGRKRSIRTEDVIERVAVSITDNPKTSTRKRASQLTISQSTLCRILKKDLKLKPYKIQLTQQLLPNDHHQRLGYSESFLRLCEDATFIENIIFSDEAHFHLTGHVNNHNSRIWSAENPREIQERPLHSLHVTVWCGISASRVYGPYFFENDNATVTVTGERYRLMIREFLIPELERQHVHHTWSQQDGAPAHTARETMALLKDCFPNRLISRFGDIPWPPRSPDLTPCDFFLWGYLKSRVYVTNPTNLQELRNNIYHEIAALSPETLMKVMKTTKKRALSCQNNRGCHLKDIIFKN